jgi:hypothetical protein
MHVVLRHMFNRAVEWDLLDKNPMERLKFLHENNARLRYLTMEECGRLLECCIAPHIRALVTMALHTGSEAGRDPQPNGETSTPRRR